MQIEIRYRTGNSFGLHDEVETLEYEWSDIAIARENLQAIYEHDALISITDTYSSYSKEKIEKAISNAKKKSWFIEDKHNAWKHSINLKKDNGSFYRDSCFWVGYFETFYSASIIDNKEDYETLAWKTLLS